MVRESIFTGKEKGKRGRRKRVREDSEGKGGREERKGEGEGREGGKESSYPQPAMKKSTFSLCLKCVGF